MKRKARSKEIEVLDTLKPIDLTLVGTKDDPCFGKHHDGTHKVCRSCGDAEICQIVMGQVNHVIRSKEESKSTLLDTPSKKVTYSELGKFIRRRLKPRKAMDASVVKQAALAHFKFPEERYDKLLKIFLKKTSFVRKKGDDLIYKKLNP